MSQEEQLKDATEVIQEWGLNKNGRGNLRIAIVCGVIVLEEKMPGGSWVKADWRDPLTQEAVLKRLSQAIKKNCAYHNTAKDWALWARHAKENGIELPKSVKTEATFEYEHLRDKLNEAV